MDHAEAVRSNTAERYLLGELTPAARVEYEEHFFGCVECAQDLQACAAFVDAARDSLAYAREHTSPIQVNNKPSLWALIFRPAVAIPAMAFLLFVVAYQNLRTIPQMRSELARSSSVQVPMMFSLIGANSRGGPAPEFTVAPNREFGFFVDIPASTQFPSYSLAIQSDSGATGLSTEVPAQEAKDTVHFIVPPSRLPSGKYSLVVRGYDPQKSSYTEIVRYPFVLKLSS